MEAAKAQPASLAAAFAIAEPWGAELAYMPLEDQKIGLRKEIYDLSLEIARVAEPQER